MTRREWLTVGGLGLLTVAAGVPIWSHMPRSTRRMLARFVGATPSSQDKVLVVLFLRGGVDGMHVVVPYHEDDYYRLRPKLGIPPPGQSGGAIDLDGKFGLNPNMAALMPFYKQGELAFVQAVGTACSMRSHLWCERFIETGGVELPPGKEGWLNRYVQAVEQPTDILPAYTSLPQVPTTLLGATPTMSLANLASFSPTYAESSFEGACQIVQDGPEGPLQRMSRLTFEVNQKLSALNPMGYRPAAGVEYPQQYLAEAFKLLAFLVKSRVGLRAAHLEISEFDSHAEQIGGPRSIDPLLQTIATSVAPFWQDLGPRRKDVVIITLTEFGRRAKENGSMGTDHGWGTSCFVLGGEVNGGQVYSRWPGLASDQLFQGLDLKVTTDYRDLFIDIAANFGCPQPEALFPGYKRGPSLGVV